MNRIMADKLKTALAELDKLAEQTLEETRVPGVAIAVVYQDEVVYLNGFGVCEVGKDEPVTADTVFQLASTSKPIASTIVAALVSDEVITWDDRISDLDPDFQLVDPWITREVSLRDMFSHRSGLYGNAGNDLEELGFERDEILRRLRYLKPAGDFRSTYAYSNFGLTAGAVAAAKATGKPWEEVAEEQVYEPLGMSRTSSRYDDFEEQPNRAHLHIPVDGKWMPRLTRDADAQSPAGGVSSTVRDLAQWLLLQLGGGTVNGVPRIKKAALAQTHQPQIVRGPSPITGAPTYYALGWNMDYDLQGRVYVNHAGAFSVGARTLVKMLPAEGLGIIVLSNAFPTGVPEGIADTFFDLVHEGKARRDWVATWDKLYDQLTASYTAGAAQYAQPPATPAAALPNSAYVGCYSNDYVGDIEVTEQKGALVLLLGPRPEAFPLTHWNRDLFLYYPDKEWPDVPSGVTFTVGADGQAARLVIENLNGDGQGRFARTTKQLP